MDDPHHNVYVIELDKSVLENKNYREANPNHRESKSCVYVGRTGKTPEERFQQHLDGYKSGKYPHKYGIRLKPRLYRRFNPLTYEKAVEMEVELARRLRKRGYAVWQK